MAMTLVPHLSVGEMAPEFSLTGIDGRPVRLADYRGRFLVVDFWATWCEPCVAQVPALKAAVKELTADPRFAVVGMSLDESAAPVTAFAGEHGVTWPQALLTNQWSSEVAKAYSVRSVPSLWLIGPDGKVIAKDLTVETLVDAVRAAMRAK